MSVPEHQVISGQDISKSETRRKASDAYGYEARLGKKEITSYYLFISVSLSLCGTNFQDRKYLRNTLLRPYI